MKRVLLALAVMALTGPAWASWHGLSLYDYSQGINMHPIADREFVNGQWTAGYGVDMFYYQIPGTFQGKSLPQLYFALDHEWNAQELTSHPGQVQGIWGPGVGTSVGGLATTFQKIGTGLVKLVTLMQGPAINLPPWFVNDLDKWVTIEGGGGYRVFGHTSDVKPWAAWVGGRVTVQFDVTAKH